MAQNIVNVRLVTRHGSATEWATSNPVLLAGELGVESDTGLMKVGNGTSAWSALEYINDLQSVVANHYEVDATAEETDVAAITRALGDAEAEKDDTCIVRRVINGEKKSYTAYIYNGTAWAAMDGNYSADNVYFSEDIVATEKVGTIVPGGSGSTTVSAAGKSVKEVLASILAKENNPTVSDPSVTVTLTGAGEKEAGTKVSPAYTTTFKGGSYQYGPATGIVAKTWEVTNTTNSETLTAANGTFGEITIGDDTNFKVTVKANYDDGAIPKTNLGNEYAAGQIKAGSKSATSSGALTGYRSYFYGALASTSADIALTSDLIRGLTNSGKKAAKGNSHTYAANSVSGAKRVVVAIPKSANISLTEVLLTSTLNANITADFVKKADVNVEGVGGYTAVPYSVWVYEPASLDAGETYKITLG